MRRSREGPSLKSYFLFCSLSVTLLAQVGFAADRFGQPAMAESSSPDDHRATSSDPDRHRAHSVDPEDLVVGSHALNSRIVGSEDPGASVVEAGVFDQHPGRSTGLQDLPNAEVGRAFEDDPPRQRIGNPSQPTAEKSRGDGRSAASDRMNSRIAGIHQAKQALGEARERKERANAAYGQMMKSGYPRGEARAKIVNARKSAQDAFDAADRHYNAVLEGGVGPANH